MATMRVLHSGFPGQEILINTEDFDPVVHRAIDEAVEGASDQKSKKGKGKRSEE